MPVHDDDDDREKEVYVDHPSGGATASTNQSAVTPEAAQSSPLHRPVTACVNNE